MKCLLEVNRESAVAIPNGKAERSRWSKNKNVRNALGINSNRSKSCLFFSDSSSFMHMSIILLECDIWLVACNVVWRLHFFGSGITNDFIQYFGQMFWQRH